MSHTLQAERASLPEAVHVAWADLRDALHAEWTKLRTVAGTSWLLAAVITLTWP